MLTQGGHDWVAEYGKLSLRIDGRLAEKTGQTMMIYRGPRRWLAEVAGEQPWPTGRLVDEANRLLEELPFARQRACYLASQVRALRTIAARLDGEDLPLGEFARQCLDIEAGWIPEERFQAAHAEIDKALPPAGPLAQRLHRWQETHSLAVTQLTRLPELVGRAVAETRRRTSAIVALPDDEVVECQLLSDATFLAAGHYAGGKHSTIFINADLPFNLADLLYVVATRAIPATSPRICSRSSILSRSGSVASRTSGSCSPRTS